MPTSGIAHGVLNEVAEYPNPTTTPPHFTCPAFRQLPTYFVRVVTVKVQFRISLLAYTDLSLLLTGHLSILPHAYVAFCLRTFVE